jgi:hypothetical protein
VIHNVDGGGFYTKWLNDFADTQVFDNITYSTNGALPDCIPYYGHGHESADAGWGIAAWTITDWFSDYYADDVFDVAWYPNMKWYMENWLDLAQKNPSGLFPLFFWGDWANFVPGPYAFKTPEYPQFFYIRALEITAKFATRLGFSADAAKYTALATAARSLYVSTFYNATSGCFAGCTYVSQVFALTLGLAGPQGSPAEVAAWGNAMDWWSASATHGIPEHFGGGIISLKLALPLLDAHGESGLALKMHLQSDEPPGFGYWVKVGGATTLWEQYNMDATHGTASRNHIMFGAAGSWYYSTLAGLGRAPDSRSWQNLVISPPYAADVLSQLSWAGASIDSPMGLVGSSWSAADPGAPQPSCGEAAEKGLLHLTCVDPASGKVGDGVFTAVDFASYGTPIGACPTFQKNATCDGEDTAAAVAALCLGKSACTLNATTNAMNKGKECVKRGGCAPPDKHILIRPPRPPPPPTPVALALTRTSISPSSSRGQSAPPRPFSPWARRCPWVVPPRCACPLWPPAPPLSSARVAPSYGRPGPLCPAYPASREQPPAATATTFLFPWARAAIALVFSPRETSSNHWHPSQE